MTQYIPKNDDAFTISWKQHKDRSYIDTIWICTACNDNLVIAFDAAMPNKVKLFRPFDVDFHEVTSGILVKYLTKYPINK